MPGDGDGAMRAHVKRLTSRLLMAQLIANRLIDIERKYGLIANSIIILGPSHGNLGGVPY